VIAAGADGVSVISALSLRWTRRPRRALRDIVDAALAKRGDA
jgi:hypothetical protein